MSHGTEKPEFQAQLDPAAHPDPSLWLHCQLFSPGGISLGFLRRLQEALRFKSKKVSVAQKTLERDLVGPIEPMSCVRTSLHFPMDACLQKDPDMWLGLI